MDRSIKNYEEPLAKRITGKEFLRFLRHKREVNKQNKKTRKHYEKIHGSDRPNGHNHGDTGHSHPGPSQQEPPQGVVPVQVAVIVDDVVIEILRVQEQFGEMLMHEPKFVILDEKKYPEFPQLGFIYRDDKFISFDQYMKDSRPTTRG